MRQSPVIIKIHNSTALKTAAFTAAVTNIITSNSHGLSNGAAVILTTTDTLPAGLSLNTIYYVINKTTNTFKLSIDKPAGDGDGVAVDVTDTGTGIHTFIVALTGQSVMVQDFRHKDLILATSGMGSGDSIVVKVQGSSEESAPNFHLAASITNQWDYVSVVDLNTGETVDGDTGITFSDSNDLRHFAINIDGLTFVNVAITTQSDVANTALMAQIKMYND